MTCNADSSVYTNVLELLLAEGSGGFREALETLLNEAMVIERSRHLKAAPYERNEERAGYSNGFKCPGSDVM
jgi:putative transposase